MAGVVLDTHVWLWLVGGEAELDAAARESLLQARERNALYLAVISVWELAMLEARGRIALLQPIDQWVAGALGGLGLRVAPLTPEIALASVKLPGRFNADPADRMIVATARALGAALATRDRGMIEYGRLGYVDVLAV